MWSILILSLASSLILNGEASNSSQSCPQNERWVDCYLAYCSSTRCSHIGLSLPCASIAAPCAGGCLCIQRYLRNSEGVCIPQDQCPPVTCGANEKTGCLPLCKVVSCEQLRYPPRCTPPREQRDECNLGCICEDGHLRDSKGVCIKKEQCISATLGYQ